MNKDVKAVKNKRADLSDVITNRYRSLILSNFRILLARSLIAINKGSPPL